MSDAPPTSPRWQPLVSAFVGLLSAAGLIGGFLMASGAWKGETGVRLTNLERRMDVAEGKQNTYIPVLIGMQTDVKYLADRARREEDRETRGSRP